MPRRSRLEKWLRRRDARGYHEYRRDFECEAGKESLSFMGSSEGEEDDGVRERVAEVL